MKNEAWLGLIRETDGNVAKFVIRSYQYTITVGAVLQSKTGGQVFVECIKVREFEPEVRKKMTSIELDRYKVDRTTPYYTWILDVHGDISEFKEDEVICVLPMKEK